MNLNQPHSARVLPWLAIRRAIEASDLDLAESSRTRDIHSIHPYPAKFIGQLPGALLDAIALPRAAVVDPFCGSGTTLVEALRRGHSAAGFDANPIATLISKAKVVRLTEKDSSRIEQLAKEVVKGAKLPSPTGNVPVLGRGKGRFWYNDHTISELMYIRDLGRAKLNEPQLLIWECALSAIVVRLSMQDGETRYSWVDKGIAPWEGFAVFRSRLRDALKHSAKASVEYASSGTTGAVVRHADYVADDSSLGSEIYDCAVFSPPYPNTFDYHLYHRLRLLLLGHDPKQLKRHEIGAHLKYEADTKIYIASMSKALSALLNSLKPGGVMALVVGDSIIRGRVHDNASELGAACESIGFVKIGLFTRAMPSERKSFALSAERLRKESILVFGKPPEIVSGAKAKKLSKADETAAQLTLEVHPENEGYTCGYQLQSLERSLADECHALGRRKQDQLHRLRLGPFFHSIHMRGAGASRLNPTLQSLLERSGKSYKKNTGYFGHALHPYVGKFYPHIIRQLMLTDLMEHGYDPAVGTVLDPFLGSGTTLVEAAVLGLATCGIDLNPVAILAAHAKRQLLRDGFERTKQEAVFILERIARLRADQKLEGWRDDERKAYLCSWFPGPQLQEVSAIKTFLDMRYGETLGTGSVFYSILSSILRACSLQKPSDLRIRRRPASEVEARPFTMMRSKLTGLIADLDRWSEASVALPHSLEEAAWRSVIHHGDTRDVLQKLTDVTYSDIRCAATSPPYAAALPYIDTDRLSLVTLELDRLQGNQRQLESRMIGNREISIAVRKQALADIASHTHRVLGSDRLCKTLGKLADEIESAGLNAGFRRRNNPAIILDYFKSMQVIARELGARLKPGTSWFVLVAGNQFMTGGADPIFLDTPAILAEIAAPCRWTLRRALGKELTSSGQRNLVHRKENGMSEEVVLHFVNDGKAV